MRKWALCFLLAGLALPALAANRVTVSQLEQVLAAASGKPDADAARQIAGLELTERLSSARLEQLRANLPGEKSQQALIALADTSAFLDPPPTDMPATATPDAATQRRIMALTVDYLGKTLPLLPNLFAARDTLRFETRPSQLQAGASDNPLHEAGKSRVTVLYRNGREFVDAGAAKDSKAQPPDKGLTTWGEFGPILGTVLIDAAHSSLDWSHWELSAAGPQAVFHYSVPKEKSHYDVRFCCVAESYGFNISVLTERVGYHGEVTVDPDTGTILRLTALADIKPGNPIGQADIAVEYGPVAIGGKTYFCPVRGIAFAQSPDLKALHSALAPPPTTAGSTTLPTLQKASLSSVAQGPQQLLLNDVAFRDFHLFRADSKVLPGDDAEAASHPPAPSAATAASAEATAPPDSAKSADEAAVDSSTLAPQPAAATTLAAAAEPASAPPEALIPEITVAPATGVPAAPALAQTGAETAVTLRLNARLVDLSLVALDKKGRPVTNIKPEDLQIFDNSAKVNLRSFAQAGATTVPAGASATQPSSAAAAQPAFSNRGADPVKPSTAEANAIVLLLDTNLSFDDLANVREQMIHFLNGLLGGERVAILAMNFGSFKVLHEATGDYAQLAAILAKWTPSARSVSLGQEQEARNRQSMENVQSEEDLLSVNGGITESPASSQQPLDANLRELGDRPGQTALAGLVDVARYLAAVPGHKSLVWIASDNVLADWNRSSLNIDKGSKVIDAAALRTQEAMNNAHVSVYPLDASRLEAGGVDAAIGTRNVELKPTSQQDPRIGQAELGPEATAGQDLNIDQQRSLNPGRAIAQMQQDTHPIQGAYRELADATGGRVFRRASDITSEFNSVAADGRATYLLSFTPPEAADGQYHLITVKLAGRKDVTLRYRSGYLYRQEPSTIKDRFRQAVLEPEDATEIGLSADPLPGSNGRTVKLDIAATDLEIAQKDAFWTDKVDVYVVQREVSGAKARVTGQTMGLRMKSATYQQYLREGIPFNQVLEAAPGTGSVRIVVVDENSGRMGSVTIPASAIAKTQ